MSQAVERIRTEGFRTFLERARFAALALGCASLFWQWDVAAADVLFGLAILASFALWEKGLPAFDFAWPQPLLLVLLTITALATTLADGSPRFLVISLYLAAAALALASALRRDPARRQVLETALIVAGCLTAITVFAGGMAVHVGWPFLEIFSWGGTFRGEGLFKDPNVAGPFVACSYPLVAARCSRFKRHRVVSLVFVTALFGCGVLYSYSRLALGLWVIAVAAVLVALAVSRDRRLLLATVACVGVSVAAVALAVAADKFPLYRYEPVQWYDKVGRFEVWRFAVDMVRESPLGTGAGSFEGRTEEYFAAEDNRKEFGQRSADESDNMLRNGALDGPVGWGFDSARPDVTAISDPASVTGHAVRMHTTDKYQGVGQDAPVVGGLTYSFAAQTRTDGTPAVLIIHWRDERGEMVGQVGSSAVTSTSWTEAQLLDQIAPLAARKVAVFLTNLEPGEQYFTAARMVEGATVPAWTPSMQWTKSTERAAVHVLSAHNTYVRIAVETGVLGLLVLCAYWIVLAWSAWRWGRGSWEWPVAFSLVLIAGLLIDTIHWRQLWVYTAVIAASFSAARVPEQRTRRPAEVQVRSRSSSPQAFPTSLRE